MLWLISLAASLSFTFATEHAADSVAIAHAEELFDFSRDARHGLHHHVEGVEQYANKPHHYQHYEHHGNERGHHSTEWHRRDYNNDWYIDLCTKHHNYHRRVHGAYDMEWDNSIAYVAQQIASSCVYAHNQQADPAAGQNIAAGLSPRNVSGVITELWYNGERPYFQGLYGQPQPSYQNFELWGHLTQVVWKGTLRFGCATQYCPNGLANTAGVEPYFTVCNYKHAGNVAGEYAQNVGAPAQARVLRWYNY